jgi:molecular chaperone DnaK
MSEVAIGIDLGTSNSAVAVVQGGRVEVLPNAYGERIMASAVAFQDGGNILVGNEAKANAVRAPARTVTSAKRLIGRYFFSEEVKKARVICPYEIVEGPEHSVRIQVGEEVFSLPEISAMILRELKSVAESHLGHAVTRAVITVPAYFNDNQRQATKDAGRIAGLEVLRILNEPTAAALAYGFGKGLTQKVAVWDLGGGTFDISILEIGEDVFEVISTAGDTFLGGDDFDDRLIDLLADEFMEAHGKNLRQDPSTLERLKSAAEAAKKGLSREDQVRIEIPSVAQAEDGTPLAVERTLTTADFQKLTMDLIQRTFKVCDEALQQAGVVARELDGVVLVGGPTRLPSIREAVREYFQKEPKTDVDPDVVVAMGAAIHAAELVAPQQQAFLLDVTPLSLQVGVAGGLCEPVIERNTPVPIEQTRSFTTVQDEQEAVVIRVYQGEGKQAEENELLGQFEFSGFPKAPRGQVEIQVTFAINSDGIVDVTASEPETGQRASTRITLSSGLSDEELQAILAENRTDRVLTDMVARAEEAAIPQAEPPPSAAPEPAPEAPPTPAPGPGRPAASPAPEPPRTAMPEPTAPSAPALDDGPDLEVEELSEEEMEALMAGTEVSDTTLPPAEAAPAPAAEAPPGPAAEAGRAAAPEVEAELELEIETGTEAPADPAAARRAAQEVDLFAEVGTDLHSEEDDEEIELA